MEQSKNCESRSDKPKLEDASKFQKDLTLTTKIQNKVGKVVAKVGRVVAKIGRVVARIVAKVVTILRQTYSTWRVLYRTSPRKDPRTPERLHRPIARLENWQQQTATNNSTQQQTATDKAQPAAASNGQPQQTGLPIKPTTNQPTQKHCRQGQRIELQSAPSRREHTTRSLQKNGWTGDPAEPPHCHSERGRDRASDLPVLSTNSVEQTPTTG